MLPKRTVVGWANALVSNQQPIGRRIPQHGERADEVGELGVLWRVQRRAAGGDVERRARERGKHAVDLPVLHDGLEHVAVTAVALPR